MSEVFHQEDSAANKLVRQILSLQKAVLPEMMTQSRDRPEGTYGGVGSYALKDVFGKGGVRVSGQSWREDELADNATAHIHLRNDNSYRVEIREGRLTAVYTQDGCGERVDDEATIKKLRFKALRKRIAYRAINLKNSVQK